MIKLKHITKKYGSIPAINDISFHLKEGEITAFIGPNGAGKTTTMKIITQTLEPSSGTCEVLGIDVYRETSLKHSKLARQKIGYLAENNPLYPDMIAGEYLLISARLRGATAAKAREALSKVRTACQLDDVINQSVSTLSKGYRQRLGVAQALIHDPEILILDEPTSGLDPNQTADFLNMLRQLENKTILFSTHILHSIPEFCHNLLFIDQGILKFDGKPKEFLQESQNMDDAFRAWTEASS